MLSLMANGTSLILVSFFSSAEATDRPIRIVVEISDSGLEGKHGDSRSTIESNIAHDAALTAAVSKGLAIPAGPRTRVLYDWLPAETWAAPPRTPDYSAGTGISAWIVRPGDPLYPTS